ncbi:MAG: late competence development ComFB family protein [Cyanobacteria bacterium P01_H01_bin.153]
MHDQQPLAYATAYFNVMELLVAEEVDHQLQAIPHNLAQYLNRSEIETFALNCLPALYAASEQGLIHQREKAQQQLQPLITQAVRRAFAAVQRDPLRASQPLEIGVPQSKADVALVLLQEVMQLPHLTWEKALEVLAELAQQEPDKGPTPAAQSPAPPVAAVEYGKRANELKSTALRPGIYGCRTAWIPERRQS